MGDDPNLESGEAAQAQGLANLETGLGMLRNLAPQQQGALLSGFAALGAGMPGQQILDVAPADLVNQLMGQPFTYTPELVTRLKNEALTGVTRAYEGDIRSAGQRFGAGTGLGRSDAGALGAANLAGVERVGRALESGRGIDLMAAQQRGPDLIRALGAGSTFLNQLFEPQRQAGLAQIGSLQGLTGAAQSYAGLSQADTGPLDFLAALPGQTLGAAGQAGGAGGFAGLFCHVASEVFGENNPQWLLFYDWKENRGPSWFKKLYNRFSERVAKFIRNKPFLKRIIKRAMLKVI